MTVFEKCDSEGSLREKISKCNTASTSSTATPTQNPCQKSFGLLNAGITSAHGSDHIATHVRESRETIKQRECNWASPWFSGCYACIQ